MNSLIIKAETDISLSSTLFLGLKLWKGAELYFNPELSAGSGFSQSLGVAGFPNGEVYRISDPQPHVYIARLYYKHIFPLSKNYEYSEDGVNQIKGKCPISYFAFYAGKFSVMDFLDNNSYSHDPRTQFYNWALMGNGAWDYPANTRGYTYGIILELKKSNLALRFITVMVPKRANGSAMDFDLLHSRAMALEIQKDLDIGIGRAAIRAISFLNLASMGSYKKAIEWGTKRNLLPQIDSVKQIGNYKLGLGLNIEYTISSSAGFFMRAGWNDGQNETWAFTEIDRSISLGFTLNLRNLRHSQGALGLAQIINGISKDHRSYLKAGGYGFIIGDGNLNYCSEYISEIYYSLRLGQYRFWISPDYQFIINPAYNKDRGPVHVMGIRMHGEI